MPAALAALWRGQRRFAVLAALLWLAGRGAAVANLSGYIGGHDDMFRAARETQSLSRSVALERVERLRQERAAIREQRPVGALLVAARHAARRERPLLREALAVAQQR